MQLEVGDNVKILRNGERFWVQVLEIKPRSILAFVDSQVIMQSFKFGDTIRMKKKEIVAVILDGIQIGE